MSRLDDIIDLIQTTNEVYFITAPGRVRTAFILVDDIVELTLKTYLQDQALAQRAAFQTTLEGLNLVTANSHRNALREYFEKDIELPELIRRLGLNRSQQTDLNNAFTALTPKDMLRHWSANNAGEFKNYPDVVGEAKLFFPIGSSEHTMLDEALARHQIRNRFYHDHRQTGLTIDDDKCLRALCGMFDLLQKLFPDLHTLIQSNNTVRCQIGVLRLKKAALGGQKELVRPYDEALDQLKRDHHYDIERRSVEHSLVHTISYRFFNALREQFIATIGQHQLRIDEIRRMKRPKPIHQRELDDKQQLIRILQNQLNDINTLFGVP